MPRKYQVQVSEDATKHKTYNRTSEENSACVINDVRNFGLNDTIQIDMRKN